MKRQYLPWLLIIIPALEIFAMIQVGDVIGSFPTFVLIVGLSLLGAYLLKKEGVRTYQQIRRDLSMGIPPGDTLLDGACILVGAVLLLVPGFLTDVAGLILLLPFMRGFVKSWMKVWLFRLMSNGNFRIFR